MQNNIIIVAGGKGLRMGSDLPKQFIPLAGKPVLMHTIEAFYTFDKGMNIVLVLPVFHHDYWKDLCAEYKFEVSHIVATGGETRFHSVKNGLAMVESGLVGVHDGVRPFVSGDLIKRCFETAKESKAVVPAINSTDSLREMISEENSKIIDRSRIRLVQTPQVFCADILKAAYEVEFKDYFTDDASVVEELGVDVRLVEGEVSNIKITTPFDLKVGEVIIG